MLRIVDMPLLWAMFSLRCVPSVYRYRRRRACQCSWGSSLSVDSPSWLFFLVAVLRLFHSCGVYLVLAMLCCAVSRFLVELCVPVCLCDTYIIIVLMYRLLAT
jgi:hypothetical protein